MNSLTYSREFSNSDFKTEVGSSPNAINIDSSDGNDSKFSFKKNDRQIKRNSGTQAEECKLQQLRKEQDLLIEDNWKIIENNI